MLVRFSASRICLQNERPSESSDPEGLFIVCTYQISNYILIDLIDQYEMMEGLTNLSLTTNKAITPGIPVIAASIRLPDLSLL